MTPQGAEFPVYEGAPVAGGFSRDELRRIRLDARLVVTDIVADPVDAAPVEPEPEVVPVEAEAEPEPVATEAEQAEPAPVVAEAAEAEPEPEPAPVDPAEVLKDRMDEIIAKQLTAADFDKSGKPKLSVLRAALPDDTISVALRNDVWDDMQAAGFSAPT